MPAVRGLSGYDIECGSRIDEAFASFQGRDPDRALARVFAAVVHRRTAGVADRTNNPLGVQGAGWVGVMGRAGDLTGRAGDLTRRRSDVSADTAVFLSAIDGSLAAALALHERGFDRVQVAYRAGDAVRLARAIESSPLGAAIDLSGLSDELAGVRTKWWSVLADGFRFRHVGSPARPRLR